MGFKFDTAARLCVNLELGSYFPGATSSRGGLMTDPPWLLKDIGRAYSLTYKYTVPNRAWEEEYVGSVNTKFLNDCEIGTYITASNTSGLLSINTTTQSVSNPAFEITDFDVYVYFGCENGDISENYITGLPASFNTRTIYNVVDFPIDYGLCMGNTSSHIVWIESPDVSPKDEHVLWYYDKNSNTSTEIENFGSTSSSSTSAYKSLFRRPTLISFTHPSLGFIICYLSSTIGLTASQGINIYDSNYNKIIELEFINFPFGFSAYPVWIRHSPDKKDIILSNQDFGGGIIVRMTLDSGPTYSLSYVLAGELWDYDFGYSYGGSPSNIYYLNNMGSYSIWDVNDVKTGSYEGIDHYLYDFSVNCGTFSVDNTLRWLLCDYKNDPSETCYLFYHGGFTGNTSSGCGAGTMTNMYFPVTYSTATYSTYTGVRQTGWSGGLVRENVIGDYTLGINIVAVIPGPTPVENVTSYAPVGHILQYYNVGSEVRVFNTSRGKVSEVDTPLSISLNSTSENYDFARIRKDDVYLLIDQDWGQFEIIYWTA